MNEKKKYFKKTIRLNRFQGAYNEKSFKKVERLKSRLKFWDFQSEATVEQIIAIVTKHSVSCYWIKAKLLILVSFFE